MMNRASLKEDMMEQVNGGEYLVFTNDTNEFIASFTSRDSMEEVVHGLNFYGMELKVKTTNCMDDKDAEGVYRATNMRNLDDWLKSRRG